MKISSMPAPAMPTADAQGNLQPSHVQQYRSLKMNTNANPTGSELPISGPSEEAPAEPTQEERQPLSPQLALLAKQRRALQQERREFENQKKAQLSQSSGSTAVEVARLKAEPLKVLLEAGVTYDQLSEAIIAGQGNSEVNALKAELEALKQGIDQKFTDRDVGAKQQVLAEMRREAEQLISSDDYEFVRETRSIPHVMQLIERTYDESGEVLDVSEALGLVEEELFKDAQKYAAFKKMQSQMAPQAPQPQPQQRQAGMRTLTNKDTASVPLSARARALAAFNGTLQKR